MSVDVGRYLARLGIASGVLPDLATLREIHARHAAVIPFENLSAFMGEAVALDLASLERKLLTPGRGGWCFEQNLLFAAELEAIGFEVRRLSARVRWNVPEYVTTPRSHMLLLVTIAGERYIADVGFGGLTLTAPLVLESGIEQATPHEPHRLMPEAERLVLQANIGGEWRDLYAFDLYEQIQADYEVSNWYLSTWPESQFVKGIIAARAGPDARHVLRNNRYQVHAGGREGERRHLSTVNELKAVLEGPLQIRLPAHRELDARLQRMIDANPSS